MRYTIITTLHTDDEPTDLELGDLMTSIADVLNFPVVESPGGDYVPADYSIDSYDMELLEASGRRIWRYSLGITMGDEDDGWVSYEEEQVEFIFDPDDDEQGDPVFGDDENDEPPKPGLLARLAIRWKLLFG